MFWVWFFSNVAGVLSGHSFRRAKPALLGGRPRVSEGGRSPRVLGFSFFYIFRTFFLFRRGGESREPLVSLDLQKLQKENCYIWNVKLQQIERQNYLQTTTDRTSKNYNSIDNML
jgi:hypothetical protein